MQRKDNKWTGGKRRFDFPPQLHQLLQGEGLIIVPGELDPIIGTELILFVVGKTPLAHFLGDLNPFQLEVKTGAVLTSNGPVMFMLIAILDPKSNKPLLLLDNQIDPLEPAEILFWRQLATQNYWHFILVDHNMQQVGFHEVQNTFQLDEGIDVVLEACRDMPHADYATALSEYVRDYPLPELYEME